MPSLGSLCLLVFILFHLSRIHWWLTGIILNKSLLSLSWFLGSGLDWLVIIVVILIWDLLVFPSLAHLNSLIILWFQIQVSKTLIFLDNLTRLISFELRLLSLATVILGLAIMFKVASSLIKIILFVTGRALFWIIFTLIFDINLWKIINLNALWRLINNFHFELWKSAGVLVSRWVKLVHLPTFLKYILHRCLQIFLRKVLILILVLEIVLMCSIHKITAFLMSERKLRIFLIQLVAALFVVTLWKTSATSLIGPVSNLVIGLLYFFLFIVVAKLTEMWILWPRELVAVSSILLEVPYVVRVSIHVILKFNKCNSK